MKSSPPSRRRPRDAAKVHGGHILYALAQRFDWFANRMMTEVHIDGGRADLIFVTKARYVTEIEIKISRGDWNADQYKFKWSKPRPSIARFYYAIPEALIEPVPNWVPEHVGIMAIWLGETGMPHAREVRAARRLRSKPISEVALRSMSDSAYYRFWRAELAHCRERFYVPLPAAETSA